MTFLHWPYRPEVVQRLVPADLEVETLDGQAWIGLLAFRMEDVRPPGLPALPWASRFPETNVRTYVRGPDGQSAIWFFSLDASRLGAVVVARATYWLRYFWSDMAVEVEARRVHYRARRRWPGPRGAHCRATVELGASFDDRELDGLDYFLTARHVLSTMLANRLAYAHAEHAPWPLFRARLLDFDQNLLQAGGLPVPEGAALVHHSPGVSVRIGAWHRLPKHALG